MKWVTFYWSILTGVGDVKIHENKDAARKYFCRNYKFYFTISPNLPRKIPLPFQVGFAHRKFIVMSKRMFDKTYGKKEGE